MGLSNGIDGEHREEAKVAKCREEKTVSMATDGNQMDADKTVIPRYLCRSELNMWRNRICSRAFAVSLLRGVLHEGRGEKQSVSKSLSGIAVGG